eukprot:2672883-Pyramimonas_sp.AAC.1
MLDPTLLGPLEAGGDVENNPPSHDIFSSWAIVADTGGAAAEGDADKDQGHAKRNDRFGTLPNNGLHL